MLIHTGLYFHTYRFAETYKSCLVQNFLLTAAAAAAKSLQSCPTLSDPMDCSLSSSSVHGIFQARVLEWGSNKC